LLEQEFVADAPRGVDDDIVDADFEDLGNNKRK